GPMLIIVHYGNGKLASKFGFDLETFGRLDVFQVDGAESRLQRFDNGNEPVRVVFIDLDVKDVDACEPLEENTLAFHNRLGRFRSDVTQPEYSSAVGNNRYQVTFGSVLIHILCV